MNYNLGRILPVFRGSYEVGTTYDKLDLVYVEGYGTYVAKTTVSSVQPQTNPDVWQIVSKDITSQEVEELFEANEEERNELVQAMIDSASSAIQSAITTLTNSVNAAIDDMNDTVDAKMDEADAKLSSFQNTGNALITSQTNTFNAAEEQREETLETAISTLQAGDTTFKNTLQSGVNTWLNEREVEFNESQDERDNEFDSQMNSQLNQFTTAQTQRANTFTANETERANTFEASEAERETTFEASEAERAEIFETTEAAREEATAAIVEEHEKLLELDAKKANKDGYYEEMTVGLADNLISPDGVVNNEPYIYRTTAGSTSVSNGNAEIQKIEGNSIVWNQLANPTNRTVAGLTFSVDEEKVITINGTVIASYSTLPSSFLGFSNIPGHKYIFDRHTIQNADNVSFTFGLLNRTGKKWFEGGFYYDNTTSQSALATTVGIEGLTVGEVFNNVKVVVQTIDLTQMFGAGNEPSTVAEFERLFPLDYYDYNEGELVSFNGTAIKSVGFNQLVGEPINVKADSFPAFSDRLYTRLIAGKEYQLTHKPLSVTKWRKSYKIYSLDGTLLTTYPLTFTEGSGIYYSTGAGYYVENADNTNTSSKFSSNKDCYIYVGYGGGTVTEDTKMEDTCIHLSHSGYRDGEYEPYWTDERELPVSKINTDGTITESAVGKTRLFPDGICSAGNIYDEITPTKAIKRIGRVDLGTLNWQRVGAADFYTFDNTTLDYRRRTSYLTNAICINYAVNARQKAEILNKECSLRNDGRMFIRDDSYSTVAAFKTAMSGVYLYYELATPIEVDFATTPQDFGTVLNLTYKEDDFGTEEFIKETDKETAPVKASTFYMINLRDKIRNIDGSTDAAALMIPSLDELLTTLGTALNGTLTKSWNSTNNKWEFTFTPTPEEGGNE